MDNNKLSPLPIINNTMNFPDAIAEVIKGNQITRMSWDSKEDCYGLLADGFLTIHIKGEFKRWIVNDGDLLAQDWIIR